MAVSISLVIWQVQEIQIAQLQCHEHFMIGFECCLKIGECVVFNQGCFQLIGETLSGRRSVALPRGLASRLPLWQL